MVTLTINIPPMLVYIPAPWILWVMEQWGFLAFHMPLENRRPLGSTATPLSQTRWPRRSWAAQLLRVAMARSRSPKQKNGPVQPVTVEEERAGWVTYMVRLKASFTICVIRAIEGPIWPNYAMFLIGPRFYCSNLGPLIKWGQLGNYITYSHWSSS